MPVDPGFICESLKVVILWKQPQRRKPMHLTTLLHVAPSWENKVIYWILAYRIYPSLNEGFSSDVRAAACVTAVQRLSTTPSIKAVIAKENFRNPLAWVEWNFAAGFNSCSGVKNVHKRYIFARLTVNWGYTRSSAATRPVVWFLLLSACGSTAIVQRDRTCCC